MKTKTLLFIVIAFLFTSLQTMAQNDDKHILVAYFSATGTTARAAEKLADLTGGELYAITPVESYTSADLDWNDMQSRSSAEMNDPKARPAIKGKKENIADYDVIFIGYPIWWDLAPRVVNTFIESHEPKRQNSHSVRHIRRQHAGRQCSSIEEKLSLLELERGTITQPCR